MKNVFWGSARKMNWRKRELSEKDLKWFIVFVICILGLCFWVAYDSEETSQKAGFVKLSDKQLEEMSDVEGLNQTASEAMGNIGVKETVSYEFGNYRTIGEDYESIELKVTTDLQKNLLAKFYHGKVGESAIWFVDYIKDMDTEKYYYSLDTKDIQIYDYSTGKLKSDVEISKRIPEIESQTESESEMHSETQQIESESESISEIEQMESESETLPETESDNKVSSNSKVSEMQYNGEYITDVAARDMEEYDYITDITILVDESKREINIAVQVPTSTDEDTVKMAGEDVARYLASMASWLNSDYKAPGSTDIGGIYDKYDLKLYLDDGFGNIDIWGAKVTYSNRITWN